jgi:hypothetical protein
VVLKALSPLEQLFSHSIQKCNLLEHGTYFSKNYPDTKFKVPSINSVNVTQKLTQTHVDTVDSGNR